MPAMRGRKEQTVVATSGGSRSMKLESSAGRSSWMRGFLIAGAMLVSSISSAWTECLSVVIRHQSWKQFLVIGIQARARVRANSRVIISCEILALTLCHNTSTHVRFHIITNDYQNIDFDFNN